MDVFLKGIYLLFDGNEIVYVGQSSDIYRRIYEHSSGRAKGENKKFDSWNYFVVDDDEERNKAEKILIKALRPKYNIDIRCDSQRFIPQKEDGNEKISNKLEWFVKDYLRISHSMSFHDAEALLGIPSGTIDDLVRNHKIQENDLIYGDYFWQRRISNDFVLNIAKKCLIKEGDLIEADN